MDKVIILSWNVRGTNKIVNRLNIRSALSDSKATILCVQETKRAVWCEKSIGSLGVPGEARWIDSLSQGLSGGLLMVWDNSFIKAKKTGCNQNWQWIIASTVGCTQEFICINIYAPQKELLQTGTVV